MSQQPESIGPYRILEPLGRGGMGVIYRCVHRRSGAIVALKTVSLPHESLLQGIRREIHALSRIRHPGIVRILDEGVHEGLPWYAMELLQGQPLGRALAGASASRLPALGPVLTLVRRLCAPLAYLHGEGIVHRDLKPDNILLIEERGSRNGLVGAGLALPFEGEASLAPTSAGLTPVLVDFGLVSRFTADVSREALELSGSVSGTVEYMAPEQLLGELIDARADLYSLGCILYELLTGRLPFEGQSAAQVAQGHLKLEPRPPSELREGVPPQLDALLLQLLAKRPRERLGHALDVAAALAALGAEDGQDSSGPRPKSYLYRSALAGRSAAMETLLEQLSKLGAGQGGFVLVGGESGAGKTRLMMELGREARRRKFQVLTGECAAQGGALQAFARPLQAVADRCRERGQAETERLLGRRGKVLALYEPALEGLPGQDCYPEPAQLGPKAARLRLFGDLAATLAALTEERPTLLLLDDLHWADELTLGFLEHLLRAAFTAQGRTLIIGTCRTEEAGERLRELASGAEVRNIALGRMEEAAVGAMVGDMLALSPPPALFVCFLSRQSEGNPFFVGEYLRTAVAEELLYRDAAGRWQVAAPGNEEASESVYEALPLPSALQELVGRRLDGLGVAARRLVDRACVLGRKVDEELLSRMGRRSESWGREALRELLSRQVLEESEGGGLRFLHDQIREAAYVRLSLRRRRELHRGAAQAIEERFGADRAEVLAALGHHWEQARVARRAQECYLGAARHEVSRYAHADAERLYLAYLALVDRPTSESAAARNALARRVLQVQGREDETYAQYQQALDEARLLGDLEAQAASLLGLAQISNYRGRVGEARNLDEQALLLYRQAGHRKGEGQVLSHIGRLYGQHGQFEEAKAHMLQAIAIFQELKDRECESVDLGNLGILHRRQGRLDEARAFQEAALLAMREVGDHIGEAVVISNLACICTDEGRIQEAQALFEQALRSHRDNGSRPDEVAALGELGRLEQLLDRPEAAQALYEQAICIERAAGSRNRLAVNLNGLASCLRDQGRLEEACTLYQQCLDLAREAGAKEQEGTTLREMAILERQAGTPGRAERLLSEAELLLRPAGEVALLCLCACERGHLALHWNQPARPLLAEALELAGPLQANAQSELGKSLSRLQRAVDALEAGRPLYRGQLVEDLPEGLRRWLAENGQLAEGQAFSAAPRLATSRGSS